MNISLPKALEEYVRAKVASGQYASASEVIRESLRDMQAGEARDDDFEARRQALLDEIRRKVAEGKQAIAEGRYITGEEFAEHINELREQIRRRQPAQSQEAGG